MSVVARFSEAQVQSELVLDPLGSSLILRSGASVRLPTTYYLLPTIYYLLPTIYYLLPTILLLINTYNLRPVKSLFSTDRYAYAKRSLFRLWEPQPPDSSSEIEAPNSARVVRQSGAESDRG